MIKRLIIELLLFALPFVAHYLYLALPGERRGVPYWLLGASGFALAAGALLWAGLSSPSDRGKCYQVAHYDAGVYTAGAKRDCNDVTTPSVRGATEAARDDRP